VTVQTFGVAFLLGAAAVALWVDARFPALAPADLRRALGRTALAIVASRVLFPPAWEAALARGSVLVALFAIALPCLTCVLLSTIWSIRRLQAAMRGAGY
jgi:hypothetical protein